MDNIIVVLEPIIQLSMIIMIGIYFIFSNTVMAALKPFDSGAEVMVEINRIILNPIFMAIFMISGLGSLLLMLFQNDFIRISGAIFFVGTTLVTVTRNVPLNNALRDAGSELNSVWQKYLKEWVFWNHVRSLSAVTSGLLLIIE